ncbi:uncharacterized protein LOC115481060 isoform X2 [Microcaecilia unicolor]|uniref:Uncharacterized protein LOC115481060 isoform X2 n=1 Tax=Microcaecilia unicolor TaxID=1415580 RepID=A0A6P7ZNE3_9AMPH|nr:uncharacterized protein LOC115481060 isoform X2 [Microcaecilia unicolor]
MADRELPVDATDAAHRSFNFGLDLCNPSGFGFNFGINRPSPDRPGGVGVGVNVGRPGGVGVDVNVGRPSSDKPGGVGVGVNVGRPGGVGVDVNVGRPSSDKPGGVGVGVNVGRPGGVGVDVNVGKPSSDRPSGVGVGVHENGTYPVMYYGTTVPDAVQIIRRGFGHSQDSNSGHAVCLTQDIASVRSHLPRQNPNRQVILKVQVNLPRDQVVPNNLGEYCIWDYTLLQPVEVMEAPGAQLRRLQNMLERLARRW